MNIILLVLFILLVIILVLTIRQRIYEHRDYQQLQEEQKKTVVSSKTVLDLLPIGYHSINKDGIIIEINQTELDWLGYSREEVVGKLSSNHLIEIPGQEIGIKIFKDLKEKGHVKNIQLNIITKSGQLIPALVTSNAVYDKEVQFSHSITTIYNFTERKKLEDDLIAARQDAENAHVIRQLFMANMSHEIRTPLNAILGFSNLLAQADLAPNLREYVQGMQVSGANLLVIVNDILDFEKIRSGMLRIEQVQFDLPGLLHSVVTMMRTSAEDKHLQLQLFADPSLPPVLLGDPMRLTQILGNLLNNAIKFTDQGSVSLHVQLLPPADQSDLIRIRFEVADTGIGINPTEHSRIFERFAQAGSNISRIHGGTGLGLALVKMLVELQHGTIQVFSEPGKGARFIIEIPYSALSATDLASPVEAKSDQILPDLSAYHVLLVEDHSMGRRIAELYLLQFGLTITQAEDGPSAIKLLLTQPDAFHLVFMDIQMPKMDGYATTQLIRSSLGRKDLPIIAMTAHVLAGERKKVLTSGMNDYLTKPIEQKALTTVLLRYLTGFWDAQSVYNFTGHNPDNFLEIAELFIRQFPLELLDLHAALQKNDLPTVASVSHNLRSTTGYSGFQKSLGKTLLQIENAARGTSPNAVLLHQLYAKLKHDGDFALAILQNEISKKPDH